MRHLIWIVVAAALAGACTQAPPEMQVVNDAAEALGGTDRIQVVKTLVIEGEGTASNLLQNRTPEAPQTIYKVTEFKRALDPTNGRMRMQQVRTAQFEFALATVQRQHQGLDDLVAYNVGQDGMPTRAPETAARDRRVEMLHHPVTVVRAALDAAAKVSNLHPYDNYQVVDITTAKGDTLTLAVDDTTKLPAKVTSMSYHNYLGDVAIETSFSDYEDVSGLKLPKVLKTTIDKYPQFDLRVTKNTVDGDVGDLTAPDAVKSAGVPQPQPINVTAEEVAKGIWWLAGSGNHRSILFEFDDHLTLFEVPLSEARTQAVIAKAKTVRPEKPLTHAVVSHHHPDHAGGVRAAVAEGLTIVTHRGNEAFFKELVGRRHSIVQDALAKNPQPLKIEPVDEELTLSSGKSSRAFDTISRRPVFARDGSQIAFPLVVRLYHVKNDSHIDNLLFAYVPRDRMLVQADLYDVAWLRQPWAATMLQNLEQRKLRVEKHVPVHGAIQTHAEVLKTIRSKQSAQTN